MTSLISRNAVMALQSIRSSKTRSLLTMLGIIIGVASVITAVSLGEGVRQQVAGSTENLAEGVITIRPGKLVERGQDGRITRVNYLAAIAADSLTEQDVQSIGKLASVDKTVPLSIISALPARKDGRQHESTVIGTTPDFPDLLKQKISYGAFFGESQTDGNIAIIGKSVAEELFEENVPIGQIMVLRNQEFIVGGVFDTFEGNALTSGGDLNNAVFIPYTAAKRIASNNTNVFQILVRPEESAGADEAAGHITERLTQNHGGQLDFTVLKHGETLTLAGKTITLATSFIAGIAAISLIVGGIGIMNIMFVSVTERTREIGIRKSLGATNGQIYSQFLIEAAILSITGGIVGVLIALGSNFLLTVLTDIKPAVTLPIIGIAVLASVAVGIIFGTVPAIKAARKDPIESLRYE
jgi:putative ABC transport system permease protein